MHTKPCQTCVRIVLVGSRFDFLAGASFVCPDWAQGPRPPNPTHPRLQALHPSPPNPPCSPPGAARGRAPRCSPGCRPAGAACRSAAGHAGTGTPGGSGRWRAGRRPCCHERTRINPLETLHAGNSKGDAHPAATACPSSSAHAPCAATGRSAVAWPPPASAAATPAAEGRDKSAAWAELVNRHMCTPAGSHQEQRRRCAQSGVHCKRYTIPLLLVLPFQPQHACRRTCRRDSVKRRRMRE